MTVVVGIRCKDGVVIGADSSATSSFLQNFPVLEDHVQKIDIVGDRFIIAGSGSMGIFQLLREKCNLILQEADTWEKSKFEFGKAIRNGFEEELNTIKADMQSCIDVLIAYDSKGEPTLMEISAANTQRQPEWKELHQLWYASIGSGQIHADPFLGFLRSVYVPKMKNAPDLKLGKFMAYWTVRHVCNVNAGGVKEPIYLATLSKTNKQRCMASMVPDEELSELREMVNNVTEEMSSYLTLKEGV